MADQTHAQASSKQNTQETYAPSLSDPSVSSAALRSISDQTTATQAVGVDLKEYKIPDKLNAELSNFVKQIEIGKDASGAPVMSKPFLDVREIYDSLPKKLANQLLTVAYNAFSGQFPDKNEIDPKSEIKGYLQDKENYWTMLLFVDENKILGGYNFRFLEGSELKTAVGEHLWNASGKRGGLGTSFSQTFDAFSNQRGCHVRIGELNDPSLMTAEEKRLDATSGITPEGRVQFYQPIYAIKDAKGDLRGGKLNCPYIQPALAEDQDPVVYEGLSIKKYSGYDTAFPDVPADKLPIGQVRGLITGYNATMVDDVKTDPSNVYLMDCFDEFEKRQQKLQPTSPIYINIIPLTEPRTFIQDRAVLGL